MLRFSDIRFKVFLKTISLDMGVYEKRITPCNPHDKRLLSVTRPRWMVCGLITVLLLHPRDPYEQYKNIS